MQVQTESMKKRSGFHGSFSKYHHEEMSINNPNNCFRKGSYIELSTGVLRRVEDIRTEDFIQSALRSPEFDIKEATVVKIDRSATHIFNITFSYDSQHTKVNMEVSPGHPLFVYGQGWASCSPNISFQLYDLKCQQLQVGDICLSLVQREYSNSQNSTQAASECINYLPAPQPSTSYANSAFKLNTIRNSYHFYAEMANLVSAYTQQMLDKIIN